MKKYLLMLSLFSVNLMCVEDKPYTDFFKALYEEIGEFLVDVRHTPVKDGENPFFDPTKPVDAQSKWCKECGELYNKRKLESQAYHYLCEYPTHDLWQDMAVAIIKQQNIAMKKKFLEIPRKNWPNRLLEHPSCAALRQRFAVIGIISVEKED